eukprot:GGOE01046016.1.p1 GENE.GGOE01046016.1~~GGOE01046016.1.p1  ORF type:complete len:407 (-),score=97.01 GGOE01046016.1:417-1601(-)
MVPPASQGGGSELAGIFGAPMQPRTSMPLAPPVPPTLRTAEATDSSSQGAAPLLSLRRQQLPTSGRNSPADVDRNAAPLHRDLFGEDDIFSALEDRASQRASPLAPAAKGGDIPEYAMLFGAVNKEPQLDRGQVQQVQYAPYGSLPELPSQMRKRSRTPERAQPFDDDLFGGPPSQAPKREPRGLFDDDNMLAPYTGVEMGKGPTLGQTSAFPLLEDPQGPSPFVPLSDKRQAFLATVLPTQLPPSWNAEVYEDYKTSLQDDLVPTSTQKKYVIANLTTIAKENKEHHLEVFSAMVMRLAETTDDNKLDLWCLIDNVCKRVGGRYVQAVEARLPTLLAYEMPRGDPRMREKFAKLIETWHKVFPQSMTEVYQCFNQPNLMHGRDIPPAKRPRLL